MVRNLKDLSLIVASLGPLDFHSSADRKWVGQRSPGASTGLTDRQSFPTQGETLTAPQHHCPASARRRRFPPRTCGSKSGAAIHRQQPVNFKATLRTDRFLEDTQGFGELAPTLEGRTLRPSDSCQVFSRAIASNSVGNATGMEAGGGAAWHIMKTVSCILGKYVAMKKSLNLRTLQHRPTEG
jgi:hypothetical protein